MRNKDLMKHFKKNSTAFKLVQRMPHERLPRQACCCRPQGTRDIGLTNKQGVFNNYISLGTEIHPILDREKKKIIIRCRYLS